MKRNIIFSALLKIFGHPAIDTSFAKNSSEKKQISGKTILRKEGSCSDLCL